MAVILFRAKSHAPDIRPAPINQFEASVSINFIAVTGCYMMGTLTGFYMIGTLTLNGLRGLKNSTLS